MGIVSSIDTPDSSQSAKPSKPQEKVWPPQNHAIAAKLRDFANLLEQQGADGYRENAYRKAADTIEVLDKPVSDILAKKGREGLIALPAIGKTIAGAIAELIATGRWAQLERLSGELTPEKLFLTIPGIGPKLAESLVEDSQLETLEDLEAAVHTGHQKLKGIGPRRRQAISAILAEKLGRPLTGYSYPKTLEPPADMLLQVDRMYRDKATAGNLRKIAPKRFNPSNEQWLPIMHARHDDWHFTTLFSNTRIAHELHKTNDWVVINFQKEGSSEGRSTVVTETSGSQKGKRVVRGREKECAAIDADQ